VHWRAHTKRMIIIPSTAAGEHVALSKGNTTAKFIREVLKFYGNKHINYFLLTDNQAAEHIATQPTMNEHSRSIDTRHHAIRQDYVDGEMRIGGVASPDNESDILTKYLHPPLHQKHTKQVHILQSTLQNCVLTSYYGRTRDVEQATPHRCLATTQQPALSQSSATANKPSAQHARPRKRPRGRGRNHPARTRGTQRTLRRPLPLAIHKTQNTTNTTNIIKNLMFYVFSHSSLFYNIRPIHYSLSYFLFLALIIKTSLNL
jgi:hypothetical protein